MTDQPQTPITDETTESTTPIIPPLYLLIVAGGAFIVALAVLLTQGGFGAVGFGALGVGVLALILLVVLAPQQVANALTGRTTRFLVFTVLITVLLVAFLNVSYWLIERQGWTVDLSQTDIFSINDDVEQVMQQIGVDPNIPDIQIQAFFDFTQRSSQENYDLLFSDFREASGGKIDYTFIDPDRDPVRAQLFGVRSGDFVVTLASATDDPENAEIVQGFSANQNTITNALLAVAVSGDFRAYFIDVTDGLEATGSDEFGMGDITSPLSDRFKWQVEEVTFIDLLSAEPSVALLDDNADGEVLVVPGGSQQISAEQAEVITGYLENGGDLMLIASPDQPETSLASTPDLNDYLAENYGLRFESNLILDPSQSFQSPELPAVTDITRTMFITNNNIGQQDALIMPLARTITVSENPPEDVTVYDLARTSPNAYAKTVEAVLAENFNQSEDDITGPFTVLAAAENTANGSRVVLISSVEMATNQFALFQGVANQSIVFNALIWLTGYNDFFETLPQVPPADIRPQDTPIIADGSQLALINFISLFGLPLGVLIIGAGVWALRRS